MKVEFRSLTFGDITWFKERNHINVMEDTVGIVAMDEDTHEILAMCIMDSWTKTSVQVHQVIENPMVLRHGFFEEISHFVFVTSWRRVMVGLVPANNEKAIKLNKHIGFSEVARIRNGYDTDIDYIIMEMRDEDCQFLKRDREAA
tara:strand:+ start:4756 stop:5190 length:435 start_codon:yes stop_codon:yes gene_type:complete